MSKPAPTLLINQLMSSSGVQFGTSGARGLAEAMTDQVCYTYTQAFLQHLATNRALGGARKVAIAGDFRPSTPRIMEACARAITDYRLTAVNCGFIPTPALALYGINHGIPSIMVTGSHIPDDRNGIKYYRPEGEILKPDEQAIREQKITLPENLFAEDGSFADTTPRTLPDADPMAFNAYVERYLEFFPADCLSGRHIGLYQHSTVAAAAFHAVLTGLGAQVTRLGRSEVFVPVDTEAIRAEDVRLAREWTRQQAFDCLMSADGDGDRPLLSDEHGHWLRGDVAGILCARYLGAQTVVTPVSSNTALELSGWFPQVLRTRIGSPYVISAMQSASAQPVVGYEANGGFLIGSAIELDGRGLGALPTRDALLVPLTLLLSAIDRKIPVSQLTQQLPPRFTASDRIKDFPTALSQQRLSALQCGDPAADRSAIGKMFGGSFGPVAQIDTTDGLRVTSENGEIVHLRPSGNAPELRAYTEAASPDRAQALTITCMAMLQGWRQGE